MVTIAQRWRLDIIMTIGLICCMSYSLIGKALHEWIGTAVLAQRFHLPARFWRAFLALICAGGADAFFWQNLPAHMTLSAGEFASACGLGAYLAAYFAIFILAAVLGYGLKRLLDRERSRS